MVYTEGELIVPALQVMSENPSGVDTTKIIKELTTRLRPSGEDVKILDGRNDTKFSQKVRNLKSHDTLVWKKLATYDDKTGIWKITPKGLRFLGKDAEVYEAMEEQGFKKEEISKEIDNDFSGIIIEEGAQQPREVKYRERSGKLRIVAISEFKKKGKGKLSCDVCGFNFEEKYGELGKDFIEIHHKEPVHEMDIAGGKTPLNEALKKVAPVCPNCHRVIHRKMGEMLSIEELKKKLKH